MRDGEVNRLSIEPSGLINARVITPHTTSQEDKVWGRSDWGADAREGRELWIYAEWVITERGESNLPSWSLANKDAVSQHRGLSSGVASGKFVGSR